jgi:hypothetical protein
VSDQSLRDALEKLLVTMGGAATVSTSTLRNLLAAHPAEPARPLLDREALFQLLHGDGCGCDLSRKSITINDADWMRGHIAHWYGRTDAVMELARPMPTREEIAGALDPTAFVARKDDASHDNRRSLALQDAEAVLALINGDTR